MSKEKQEAKKRYYFESTFKPPKLTDEQITQFQSDNEELRRMALLSHFDNSLPPIPKDYIFKAADKRMIELTHQAAYEINGGWLWEAEWMRNNPDKAMEYRMRLYEKFGESKQGTQATQINITTNVPRNNLDDVTIVNGEVIDPSDNSEDVDDGEF